MTIDAPRLDRSTAIPLHHQITESLRAQIAAGRYRPGDLLPPETALAAELRLSRATVRQGIATLVHEGLLQRRRGGGTTVARTDFEQPLDRLYTFHRAAVGAGRDLQTVLLTSNVVPASEALAGQLALRPVVDEVLQIERLRLLDGTPFVLERCCLPARRCSALRDADLTHPIYDLLEELCGTTVTDAHEKIRPVTLSTAEAKNLRQRRGAPAFRVERLGYAGDEPVEWRDMLICGDRYLYSVELRRGAGGGA